MPDQLNIKKWVLEARAGDQQAWSTIYQQYYPGMYTIALQISANAADAVQDAFITAYLKLHQLNDPALFGGWLKKIVIHHCYKMVKKDKPMATGVEILALNLVEEHADKLEEEERLNNLYNGLSGLPPHLSHTLLLRYYSSFASYEQIASLQGVPVGTVRSRLNQAKKLLSGGWLAATAPSSMSHGYEWNGFYQSCFTTMHQKEHTRQVFLEHLESGVILTFPGNRTRQGRKCFDAVIADDLASGSWLSPDRVISAGSLTVIESTHYNSSEDPQHCPPRSVLVLRRSENRVNQISFYPIHC